MSVICNGGCRRYMVTKPVDNGRYTAGQKRCNSCEISIRWDGFSTHVVIADCDYPRQMDSTRENFLMYRLQKKRHHEM